MVLHLNEHSSNIFPTSWVPIWVRGHLGVSVVSGYLGVYVLSGCVHRHWGIWYLVSVVHGHLGIPRYIWNLGIWIHGICTHLASLLCGIIPKVTKLYKGVFLLQVDVLAFVLVMTPFAANPLIYVVSDPNYRRLTKLCYIIIKFIMHHVKADIQFIEHNRINMQTLIYMLSLILTTEGWPNYATHKL